MLFLELFDSTICQMYLYTIRFDQINKVWIVETKPCTKQSVRESNSHLTYFIVRVLDNFIEYFVQIGVHISVELIHPNILK